MILAVETYSVLNTSANNAVTKVSMKPRSSATTNCHLRGGQERNGEQRRTKISFGRTMMRALKVHAAVGEKAHLRTKRC